MAQHLHELVSDVDWLQRNIRHGQKQRLAAVLGVSAGSVSRLLHGQRQVRAREVTPIYEFVTGGQVDPAVELTSIGAA